MISTTTPTEEGGYPREDKCRHCGAHIGYILHPMGEFAALGCCDKLECRKKEMEEKDVGH
jgi:hypothetical protein